MQTGRFHRKENGGLCGKITLVFPSVGRIQRVQAEGRVEPTSHQVSAASDPPREYCGSFGNQCPPEQAPQEQVLPAATSHTGLEFKGPIKSQGFLVLINQLLSPPASCPAAHPAALAFLLGEQENTADPKVRTGARLPRYSVF